MTEPTESSPVVVRKVWPAAVVLDSAVLRDALVYVTRYRVYVWTAENREPTLLLDSPYDAGASTLTPDTQLRRVPMTIVLEGARTVEVTRGPGCGCSNALNRFRPFTTERRG